MFCPKCSNENLQPIKLDGELPVLSCVKCEGVLIGLLYYRDWREKVAETIIADSPLSDADAGSIHPILSVEEDISEKDSKKALCCPKCRRLMGKYLISSQSENRIDHCSYCDDAWLDGGEWQLLKSLQLVSCIPNVFNERWQKSIKKEKLDAQKLERLIESIGAKDVEKVKGIKNWLTAHKHKRDILHYLSVDDD